MAKAFLQCTEPSLGIQQKILSFDEGTALRIGRSHQGEFIFNCNGLLPHSLHSVSYHHAYMCYSNGEFYIRDTSRNGTFINGYRINKEEEYPLTSGDIIQLSAQSFSSQVNIKYPTFHIKLFKPDDKNRKYMKNLEELYGNAMQLYKEFPNSECNLEELHLYVKERLKVLQVLDGVGDINAQNKVQLKQFLNLLKENNLQYMKKLIAGTSESFEEELYLQKLDHISHYMLCICCCKNYVLNKWFKDQEAKLLLIRWHFLHDHEKNNIIFQHFSNEKVPEEELARLEYESNGYINLDLKYFKIPMEKVSSLIRTRDVYVKNGFCFICKEQMIHVLMTDFIKTMKINLESMHKNLHNIWHDERITSIIVYVMKEIQFERYLFDRNPVSAVKLSEIDKLVKESFPLCMNELHYNLKKRHHLRNGGRHQYGLFLKAIGLSLHDSVIFWRHYLTKKMTVDEFFKNYHYHILHSYGAVGKMANYPPQSCKKIMQAVPSFDEYHGCPFKLLKNDDIKPLLKRNGITNEGIERILEFMGQGMPQLACKVYFDSKHDCELPEAPYHPNRYFNASREALSVKQASLSICSSGNEKKKLGSGNSQKNIYIKEFEW